jgi:hypothetical protein
MLIYLLENSQNEMMKVLYSNGLKKLTVSSRRKATGSKSTEELALTDSETLDEVIKCLVENFSIETQGLCNTVRLSFKQYCVQRK